MSVKKPVQEWRALFRRLANEDPRALREVRLTAPSSKGLQGAPPRLVGDALRLADELARLQRAELARELRGWSRRHVRRALLRATGSELRSERGDGRLSSGPLEPGEQVMAPARVSELRALAHGWLVSCRSRCRETAALRFSLRAARAALSIDPCLESELALAWVSLARGDTRPAARRFLRVARGASRLGSERVLASAAAGIRSCRHARVGVPRMRLPSG